MNASPWLRLGHAPAALVLAWTLTAPLAAQAPSDTEARALPVGAPAVGAPATPAETPPPPATFPESLTVRVRSLSWPRLWPWRFERPAEPAPLGGLPPTDAELRRLQSGEASLVEAAATKIKVDEAAAPARRAAILYLATVRCHYYPEAEAALIAALRADRNEVVRYEAAQALAQGCCCTPRTVEALQLAVSSSERDGNPAETSDRVKTAALYALQRATRLGVPAAPTPAMLPPTAREQSTAPPTLFQLTGHTTPVRTLPSIHDVTHAERRFAETAGLRSPARSGGEEQSPPPPRPVPTLPRLRVVPIAPVP